MPAPIRVDFARSRSASNRLGVALLAAGVAAIVLVLGLQGQLRSELEGVEARVEALSRKLDPRAAGALDPAAARALRARIEASNRVLDALDQPWIKLFDDLEAAMADGVVLLAFEPDAPKGTVRIVGEARDRDTLSRYLERLGSAQSLREVRLTQHELRAGKEGAGGLRFTVAARWVRPG